MLAPTLCPKCSAIEIKVKTVAVNPETGTRIHLIETVTGALCLIIGTAFLLVGLLNLHKAEDVWLNIVLMLVIVAVFYGPGFYMVFPWLKGGETLREYTCQTCKHQWRWMENREVQLLKAWLPGPWGTLTDDVWMELGPTWLRLNTFDKKFTIQQSKAARQIEFLTTTYEGSGLAVKQNGLPMINVGRIEGTINGIVLEEDGFRKLREWVPPQTVQDVRTISLRRELQGWGTSFLFFGLLQGISLSSGTAWYNPVWAFVMLVTGLLNMFFVAPPILLLDGIIIAIAGLLNVSTGESPWLIIGLLQFVWAGGLFWRFLALSATWLRPGEHATVATVRVMREPDIQPPVVPDAVGATVKTAPVITPPDLSMSGALAAKPTYSDLEAPPLEWEEADDLKQPHR